MKKMQCEVCGSTDIKKIDDSIFECQSCGVQYSKDEVQKLLVEIPDMAGTDVSQELENTNQPTSDAIYTDMDYGVTGDDINISSSSKTGAMRILNVSRQDAMIIDRLVRGGDKIKAIGKYREATGFGLAEAKNAIETYMSSINQK
jgi:hypothetical protein